MNCMKCGREVEQDQIFCQDCLAEMEKYPVKPGTVVQLPALSAEQQPKKQPHHRRPVLTAEEQVKRLKKKTRRLALALILTSVLAVFFALLAFDILEKTAAHKLLGQNYSTIVETTTEPTEPETTAK